jgi:hypothetical protein
VLGMKTRNVVLQHCNEITCKKIKKKDLSSMYGEDCTFCWNVV